MSLVLGTSTAVKRAWVWALPFLAVLWYPETPNEEALVGLLEEACPGGWR